MIDNHGALLLIRAVIAVVALVGLIARFKINPFIVLMTMSLALAAVSGMPMQSIVKSFETGVGNTLGHIAIIVALGTMLGKMMAESGGADRIAHTLIDVFGAKHLALTVVLCGFMVGLPAFFEWDFVLLVPLAFN